jgi:hypothetical protein
MVVANSLIGGFMTKVTFFVFLVSALFFCGDSKALIAYEAYMAIKSAQEMMSPSYPRSYEWFFVETTINTIESVMEQGIEVTAISTKSGKKVATYRPSEELSVITNGEVRRYWFLDDDLVFRRENIYPHEYPNPIQASERLTYDVKVDKECPQILGSKTVVKCVIFTF